MCVGFKEFSDPDGKLVVLGSLGPLSGSGDPEEMGMCSVFIQLVPSNPATCWASCEVSETEMADTVIWAVSPS